MRIKHIYNAIHEFVTRSFLETRSTLLRNHLFALSYLCGFCIALFAVSINASEKPDAASAKPNQKTITIDVNDEKQEINYKEVNEFIAAQDINAVKFIVVDGSSLILSPEPIVMVAAGNKVLVAPYMASHLTDLGLEMNAGVNSDIVKISAVWLASNEIREVPTITELPVFEHFAPPVVTASIPKPLIVAAPQTMIVEPSASLSLSWLIVGTVGMFVGIIMLLMRPRRTRSRLKAGSYRGALGAAHEIVGKGQLFDFNGDILNKQPAQINTTTLNMLWQLGRFSKDSAVNTYFYMAYYIPPHRAYAAPLRKKSSPIKTKVT